MIEKFGNLFNHVENADAVCIMTNGVINKYGIAICGAGIAKAATHRWPLFPKILGTKIQDDGNIPHIVLKDNNTFVVSFPTKYDYQHDSNLELIEESAGILSILADDYQWDKVLLTRPGCGLGNLDWEDVKPILDKHLDDRFTVLDLQKEENIPDSVKFATPKKGKYKFDKIRLDDPAVWAMFHRGDTVGIFQLEKQLGQDWSRRVKPNNIQDLASVISIIRPGPLQCLAGDTKIASTRYWSSKSQEYRFEYKKIKDLYEQFTRTDRILNILSVDEQAHQILNNEILKVVKTGVKKVFSVVVRIRWNHNNTYQRKRYYQIKATEGHRFLTLNRGWQELKCIKPGEYICVTSHHMRNTKRSDNKYADGYRTFRDRCFTSYKYKCIFCDWKDGVLDVNHIIGNKTTNNDRDNLCFMCPNHHRMFSEKTISVDDVVEARKNLTLPNNDDVRWVQFNEAIFVGEEETYDISVDGPNHNYIAGDFIVHNSGMADQYADVKSGKKELEYFHPSLEPILKDTYGSLIFQEQSMKITMDLAGFSETECDTVRRGIGKKRPEIISKLKQQFIDGCVKENTVSGEEAEEIFGWIEKGQRYLFNKSHAVSYAMTSYFTAYQKVHFPTEFYTAWLTYSKFKPEPKEEIYNLVQNARRNNVVVIPPDITKGNDEFEIESDRRVMFGLSHIKHVGKTSIGTIVNKDFSTFYRFVLQVKKLRRNVAESLIKSGACDHYNMPRMLMLALIHIIYGMSDKHNDAMKDYAKVLTPNELKGFFLYFGQRANSSNDIVKLFLESLYSIIETKACIKKRISIIEAKIEKLHQTFNDTNTQNSIWEKLYLGLNLTCSAADDVDKIEKYTMTCKDVYKLKNRDKAVLHVVVDKIIRRKTGEKAKNPNKEYCYLDVSDNSGAVKGVTCWPKQYEEIVDELRENCVITIYGNKDTWRNREQFNANQIKIIG